MLNALSAAKGLIRVITPPNHEVATSLPYQPLIGRSTHARADLLDELMRHGLTLQYLGADAEVKNLQSIVDRARSSDFSDEKT